MGRLTEVLNFYHFSISLSRLREAITQTASAKTRFNVGVIGRGVQMLSKRHQQAIERLAATCRLELDQRGSIATGLLAAPPTFVPRESSAAGNLRQTAA